MKRIQLYHLVILEETPEKEEIDRDFLKTLLKLLIWNRKNLKQLQIWYKSWVLKSVTTCLQKFYKHTQRILDTIMKIKRNRNLRKTVFCIIYYWNENVVNKSNELIENTSSSNEAIFKKIIQLQVKTVKYLHLVVGNLIKTQRWAMMRCYVNTFPVIKGLMRIKVKLPIEYKYIYYLYNGWKGN